MINVSIIVVLIEQFLLSFDYIVMSCETFWPVVMWPARSLVMSEPLSGQPSRQPSGQHSGSRASSHLGNHWDSL
jgi:hypothetical protein